MAKTPTTHFIRHNTSAPSVVQAAQIALLIMAYAKASTWQQAMRAPSKDGQQRLEDAIALEPEQQALLERHADILPYLGRGGANARSVIGCPECGRFMFTTGQGTAPAACSMSLGCPGKPMKASSVAPRRPKSEAS